MRGLKKLAICVCTYKRPDGLSQLLAALSEQVFDKNARPSVQIVVVDNDASGSAKPAIDRAKSLAIRSIKYFVEERRGIPFARNTALKNVHNCEAVAFLDDDEIPCNNWLDELIAASSQHQADVVSGPVHYKFADGTPRWVMQSEYFQKKHYRTGTVLPHASTNNVLIKTGIIATMSYHFDEEYGLKGGSDIDFFSRVNAMGYRIVWSNEAVVWEHVPLERANLWWLLKRNYRLGNDRSLMEMKSDNSLKRRTIRFAKGSIRMFYGAIVLVPFGVIGLFGDKIGIVSALCSIARGLGSITASFSISYEYDK